MVGKYRITLTNRETGEMLITINEPFNSEIDNRNWEFNSAKIFSGLKDKNKKELFEDDKVNYDGKEYTIKYFEKYGMFGLSDGSEKPLGRKGSSTRYEPYILGEYHQNKMELI